MGSPVPSHRVMLSISFASAEFVRNRYGWRYGLPAYVLASFVAYSRVEANQHYTHPHLVKLRYTNGSESN